jgi:hypothetical protein
LQCQLQIWHCSGRSYFEGQNFQVKTTAAENKERQQQLAALVRKPL